jgi:hypothetical protein
MKERRLANPGKSNQSPQSNPLDGALNMASVIDLTPSRKQNVTHYAYYGDLYGTAELLNGSGYLFRADGERRATLVSYKDPELMLLGLVDVADMQHDIDLAVGSYAAVACSREMGRQ